MNTVTFLEHGPIEINEPVKLVDGETGAEILPKKFPVYLCRCGQSSKKPFCDSTHKKVGFVGTCARATNV
jgi:CDGSH-type Zn-finger protein